MVQGTYEEIFQGTTSDGNAEGKLVIKFEAARWLTIGTNEVGSAEFSELVNAPVPYVSGSGSYDGRVKGSGSGGDSYDAASNFAGPLSGDEIILSVPEYTDTGNGFKIKVFINPKLKGKCSVVAVRNGETATGSSCRNGTYFFTASSPVQIDENDEPSADTATIASFGIELDVEPEVGPAGNPETSSGVDEAARARRELEKSMRQGPAGDAGIYAWRGAVTNGSKETGFKILLNKTKEQPSDDKRGHSTRKLVFSATIVPGEPK